MPTIEPSPSILGRYLLKRNENTYSFKVCTWMLLTALFMIPQIGSNKGLSLGDQINCGTSTHENYSAIEKHEPLLHATT